MKDKAVKYFFEAAAVLIAAVLFFATVLLSGCGLLYNGSAPYNNNEINQNQKLEDNQDNQDNNQDNDGEGGGLSYQRGVDYGGINYAPWDVDAASKNIGARAKKPYTVMVYMNGSDLESDYGAATVDLIEMLDSGADSQNLNLIVFTGGTNRWRNSTVPSNQCAVWEIADGSISKIASVGLRNMGNPGTLSSFISFCTANYPAEKMGLIFWDHGGGSIAGFGHDEKFYDGSLTLLKMNYAFEKSLAGQKLEFLGFDSCLMATAEMAVVASPFFNYMIASEDLEPGDGWDYFFLRELNNNPYMSGAELGRCAADYFMNFYAEYYGDDEADLTMSVTDLSKAYEVMQGMGRLMSQCSEDLLAYKSQFFNTLSNKRNQTKTFGTGSPRDNESDMVDIGDMAANLLDVFPDEANDLLSLLNGAVVYNVHNCDKNLYGLSSYYVYGGKSTGLTSLSIYANLKMDGDYTGYLNRFFGYLKNSRQAALSDSSDLSTSPFDLSTSPSEPLAARSRATVAQSQALSLWRPFEDNEGGKDNSDILIMAGIKYFDNSGYIDGEYVDGGSGEGAQNTLWPLINGRNVCLYKISESSRRSLFAVPVSHNGRDGDLIVLINDSNPNGKILGVRYNDGFIIQKGNTPLNDGDTLSFYFKQRNKNDTNFLKNWHKSEEITLNGALALTWAKPQSGVFAVISTDASLNESVSDLSFSRKSIPKNRLNNPFNFAMFILQPQPTCL